MCAAVTDNLRFHLPLPPAQTIRLQANLLTQKQKSKASNVMQKLFGAKAFHAGRGNETKAGTNSVAAKTWGRLRNNVDILVQNIGET